MYVTFTDWNNLQVKRYFKDTSKLFVFNICVLIQETTREVESGLSGNDQPAQEEAGSGIATKGKVIIEGKLVEWAKARSEEIQIWLDGRKLNERIVLEEPHDLEKEPNLNKEFKETFSYCHLKIITPGTGLLGLVLAIRRAMAFQFFENLQEQQAIFITSPTSRPLIINVLYAMYID